MAAPTTYTEEGIGAFMLAELGPLGADLGWTTQSDVQDAIDEALLSYGVGDIADATDVRKLRALARVEAWQLAVNATVVDVSSSTDGQSIGLNGRHDNAVARLALARRLAQSYASANVITVGRLRYEDPLNRRRFRWDDDREFGQ